MKNLVVRIDEELHALMKSESAIRRISIQQFIDELLRSKFKMSKNKNEKK